MFSIFSDDEVKLPKSIGIVWTTYSKTVHEAVRWYLVGLFNVPINTCRSYRRRCYLDN